MGSSRMDGIDGWDARRADTWEENEKEKKRWTYGGMFRRPRIQNPFCKFTASRTPVAMNTHTYTHTASTFYEKQNNSTHLYH